MALKKTFQAEDNFGKVVTLTDAYFRVSQVSGDKYLMHVSIEVLNSEKNRLLMQRSVSFTPSVDGGAPNFIEQAYEHLKSLPEFSEAQDC
jgi:hypothetical protein